MVRFFSILLLVGLFSSAGSRCVFAQSAGSPLNREEKVVMATILAEAKSEGFDGMRAVACVIKQRMIERKMGASDICLQKKQFSCWNDGTSVDSMFAKVTRNTSVQVTDFASSLAKTLVSGKDLDRGLVKFANHYCTVETNPYWAKGKTPVVVIGHHKFYKL